MQSDEKPTASAASASVNPHGHSIMKLCHIVFVWQRRCCCKQIDLEKVSKNQPIKADNKEMHTIEI